MTRIFTADREATPGITRDIDDSASPAVPNTGRGQMYVMAIGIDRYRVWGRLHNAVGDALGAVAAFEKLGLTQVRPPLLNEEATGQAIRNLVTDELKSIGANDSLVVFFAGHGHTITKTFSDGDRTKSGYLIPVDADLPSGRTSTWLGLKSWLNDIATLPAKHILVILDACHSGVALDPVFRWRGADVRTSDAVERLRSRRSRRIITSALDDQLALDSGPLEGHSLFTGCLIEALTGGIPIQPGRPVITGSELGLHVQNRVTSYPSSKQTPDFGALELDNRGELIFELSDVTPKPSSDRSSSSPKVAKGSHDIGPKARAGASLSRAQAADAMNPGKLVGPTGIRSKRATTAPPIATETDALVAAQPPLTVPMSAPTSPPVPTPGVVKPSAVPSEAPSAPLQPEKQPPATTVVSPPPAVAEPPARPGSPALDAAFVAKLDLHSQARKTSAVLSVVAADPMTSLTGWAAWAARRGWLTLVTEGAGIDATIADLLAYMPWLRTLRGARARLAAAVRTDASAIDAALDARSPSEREIWIEDVAGRDPHAHVSGWLLSKCREQWANISDLSTAPSQGPDLLSILGGLSAPISVLIHHSEPTAAWLERAIQTAAELIAYLPGHAVAIGAPADLVRRVLRDSPESRALAMARQGVVPLSPRPAPSPREFHARTEALLLAIARHPSLANLFVPNAPVPTHDRERAVSVDLFAKDALLAIQIDDWYHVRDPKSYRRDRTEDVWLQRAGFFVMRFLAEDVEDRLERVVEEIALGVGTRRAVGSLAEQTP